MRIDGFDQDLTLLLSVGTHLAARKSAAAMMRAAECHWHLLSMIPYEDLTPEAFKLPAPDKTKYIRPPIEEQNFIPAVYRR